MTQDIDVNKWVDQIDMDEDRDNRRFGNDEFDYMGYGEISTGEDE